MLEFLKRLFYSRTATPVDASDRRRFAGLVLTELKLYNERTVTRLRQDPELMKQLLPELRRAYETYVQRTDRGAEAGEIFREEVVRILANGDAQLLEPALSGVLQGK